jgi:hypothetical protein
MMRRPDQLTGMRISLGRRQIEPESFVSSSCVGDQYSESLIPRDREAGIVMAHGQLRATEQNILSCAANVR